MEGNIEINIRLKPGPDSEAQKFKPDFKVKRVEAVVSLELEEIENQPEKMSAGDDEVERLLQRTRAARERVNSRMAAIGKFLVDKLTNGRHP